MRKPIDGFDGYEVDSDGAVWSRRLAIRGGRIGNTPRKLNPVLRRGYERVGLRRSGRIHWRSVHRLVLEAFVGPCPTGMEALHGPDPSKRNNQLCNLRWGTPKENGADSRIHGTSAKGSRKPDAKLSESDIPVIRALVSSGESRRSVARKFGVSHVVVNGIISGKLWSHVPACLPELPEDSDVAQRSLFA